MTVLEANLSPKIDPGALRERLGRLLRATSAPRALRKRSWRPPAAEKIQGRPWENFPTRLTKIWHREGIGAASGRHRSAVLAEPVKAYPGGFRPGKTRLKNSKHALTASGGRRIDHGFANTADHPLLARRIVASGCLQKKACFACLLAWLAWLAWLACFVAAWLLRSAL